MDFSSLSNEQLIELLKAAMGETIVRGQEVADAAREVLLTEKEKANIRQKAREKLLAREKEEEANRIIREEEEKIRREKYAAQMKEQEEKQKKTWATMKTQSEKLVALCPGGDLWVNVWNGSGEKRVYINNGEPFSRGSEEMIVFYATGNHKKAPGSIVFGRRIEEADKPNLKALLEEIGKYWKNCKFSTNEALQYNG